VRWAGHVPCMEEMRDAYNSLCGKPEGKRPLGRPRRRWEDNIRMDIREIRWGDVDWKHLDQGLVAGSCEHSNERSGSITGGEFFE